MILRHVKFNSDEWENVPVNIDYRSWSEYNWLGVRWFIKNTEKKEKRDTTVPFITIYNGSLYLRTPSRQDPVFDRVNVLSSKGHGFCVSDTGLFIEIMKKIGLVGRCESSEAVDDILKSYTIDEDSKSLILELRGEKDD